MADFDRYTNYREDAGVSGVVFGANSTVLEVELNEMQEIQKQLIRNFIKFTMGNGITNINKLTYTNRNVNILDGCGLIVDGYCINCTGLSLPMTTDGTVYLQVWEEVVDGTASLKEHGNQQSSDTIDNWIRDPRSPIETTRRKVLKYTLSATEDIDRVNVPIAKITNGIMTKLVREINFDKLSSKVDAIDVQDMRDVYGVEMDLETGNITRLAGSVGKNGGTDFDDIKAFNRRRCIITETDGTVIAYYGDAQYYDDTVGYTTKQITAIDGTVIPEYTNINTVVEQNKFYYKVVPVKIDGISDNEGYHLRKVRYYISDTYKPGFKVHPAFIKKLSSGATLEFDKIYIGAYKSVAYNEDRHIINSDGFEEGNEIDYNYARLVSVSGVKPVSGSYYDMSVANMRKMLTYMDPEGYWRLKDVTVMSMDILLFLIEYATLNAQSIIGRGYVDIQDNDPSTAINITGTTASLGNKSSSPLSNDGKHSISYRGEEDIYGGLFEFIEGFKIGTATTWTNTLCPANTDPTYESSDFYINPKLSGHINAFGFNYDHDWMFIPTQIASVSNVLIGDTISPYQYSGECIIAYGGNWYHGTSAGMCSIRLMSGNRDIDCGSRIVYFPYRQATNIT